jgi:N-hydroxyarylamine O-acetyltransferase
MRAPGRGSLNIVPVTLTNPHYKNMGEVMPQFTLERYLQRTGFQGQVGATLSCVTKMMRCQLHSVPFENLDIQAGRLISLDHDDIAEKILDRQRGGYCFEVNGLFAMALDALAIPYFFIAASPLTHHNVRKPKTHMALVVQVGDAQWLCDCGYGGYGLREPLRIDVLDTATTQDDDAFMLNRFGEQELVLKSRVQGIWEAQYAFDLTPQRWADFAAANHYNSTHHESLFVRKLLVVLCTLTGRKILFGSTLKILDHGQQVKQHVTPENRQEILQREFGLVL